MDNEQKENVISLPRDLVEYILLGPTGDRRQLQDSPILVDVWIAFAEKPGLAQELLITPHRDQQAGAVAAHLYTYIRRGRSLDDPANIAYLQGIIAARLYFAELLRIIVPMTDWWKSSRIKKEMHECLNQADGLEKIRRALATVERMVERWSVPSQSQKVGPLTAFERYAALAGLILWAGKTKMEAPEKEGEAKAALVKAISAGVHDIIAGLVGIFRDILELFPVESAEKESAEPQVYQVALNRKATMALIRSVPAVKGDAARTLFAVNCSKIAWAVIDCGIQGDHEAFKGPDGRSRVKASFDFSRCRKLLSVENLMIFSDDNPDTAMQQKRLEELWHQDLKAKLVPDQAIERLRLLAEDTKNKRPIHWEALRPFIEINIDTVPPSDHGTHVAGIIGAARQGAEPLTEDQNENLNGMCPDIQLYDFRVLAPVDEESESAIENTEFNTIAALQYIRYLNDQNQFFTIHGANISLSLRHNVHNSACGHTPVCVECERLVASGVVVVAAAGNFGYHSFQTKEGLYEGYAATSITDPGNANGVITVGSTHRFRPHTYGVSFFSSRGPTGDGRMKPDILAPGERIRSAFREDWGDLDGTSMAAPHVSAAAAMLMARFEEFIGEPRRIKDILCQSATDLGRERSFQGHGMLDVLRAFQSI